MHEPVLLIVLTALAAFLVGLSKGGLPAVATLGVPVLALVMSPVAAAALLLPIYIVTDWVGLWLYRRDYSARNLRILVPSGLLGVLVGWAVASRVSDAFVGLLVGAVGLGYCLNAWARHRSLAEARPADLPRGIFWGTLAGFTSFVSHSGAPPFQMYVLPQKLEKLAFAGTATILFAIINAAKLVPYWQLGSFRAIDPALPLTALPVGILGTWVGAKLTRIMPDRLFFGFVQAALFLVSLKLVWDFF
ncbi:sulfite exporter TauE/SafE family protein [Amaricoccus sp.]|uniref:sulfite exporter TauE/SafE family protein n=1 Tax=Amaricoccus sp. TaxID=1872485 RepID=UPI002635A023|nr:sulfite exporter TauE/SafE family protein [Amaricoccus sp.]HRO10745.1 sulfite exporter TauE/SafE family protein [Amaricoccus sp.]